MKLFALTFAAALCANSLGQIGGTFNPNSKTVNHLYLTGSPAYLVELRTDVKTALDLSADQLAKIDRLAKTDAANDEDLRWQYDSKVLTPAQRERARQLSFQTLGALSVLLPSVAKELNLTPKQSARIAAIKQNFLLSNDKEFAQSMMGKEVDPKDAQANREQMIRVLTEGVTSVLTKAQLATIQHAKGPAFTFNPPVRRNGVGTWIAAMGMH